MILPRLLTPALLSSAGVESFRMGRCQRNTGPGSGGSRPRRVGPSDVALSGGLFSRQTDSEGCGTVCHCSGPAEAVPARQHAAQSEGVGTRHRHGFTSAELVAIEAAARPSRGELNRCDKHGNGPGIAAATAPAGFAGWSAAADDGPRAGVSCAGSLCVVALSVIDSPRVQITREHVS